MFFKNAHKLIPYAVLAALIVGCAGSGGTDAGNGNGGGGGGGTGAGGDTHLVISSTVATNVTTSPVDTTNITGVLANGGKQLIISAVAGTLPNRTVVATILKTSGKLAVGDTFILDGSIPVGISFSDTLSATTFHAWAANGGVIKVLTLTATSASVELQGASFKSDDPNSTGTFKVDGTIESTKLTVK